MVWCNRIIGICISIVYFTTFTSAEMRLEGYFYEIEPYIFTDENGQIEGLFKQYFDELLLGSCDRQKIVRNQTALINYDNNLGTNRVNWTSHYDTFINDPYACFFPIMDNLEPPATPMGVIEATETFSSEGLAVIIRLDYISFLSKLLRAMYNMQLLAFVAILAVVVGGLFWIIERNTNDGFCQNFIHGSLKGVWLAFVTMTSVGYGDVTTLRFASRVIAVAWMIFGLLVASLTVAIISDEFSGEFRLSVLLNKKIAVLKGIESKMFIEKYANMASTEIKVYEYETYREVLNAVRSGEVFAAVMNSDVAAYKQKDFHNGENPLAVTSVIPIEIPVKIMVNPHLLLQVKCTNNLHNEAVTHSLRKWRKMVHIETIHYDSIGNTLTCTSEGFWILMISGVLVAMGLIFDLSHQLNLIYLKTRKQKMNITDGILSHTSAIFNPATFDEELKFASKELAGIKQSLATLSETLINQSNHESGI
ncbi:uncharacterized protein [Clytia hemisphaerica]|uniref:Potassium channel domain-containing protein n=1 Tax=Clytia hemisphaerica TaxID=252671 RepID=A0A7M5WQ61_9CNID